MCLLVATVHLPARFELSIEICPMHIHEVAGRSKLHYQNSCAHKHINNLT